MTAALIPDLDERRRALDSARSFIVQAPAGSGKTELLIQRYLLLLAHVDNPEEIVAVTFTKKAAGEMRERVLEALSAAQAGKVPASDHEKLTFELANAALQRDATADWCVADNPVRLRIQTIDSLCAALTRQMPMLSRFGSQPESIKDASALYIEAARATIELVDGDDAVAQDIGRLLAHLDNDVAYIETMLADMLKRRDHWLRHVHGKERVELEVALQNTRRAALEHVYALLPTQERAGLKPLADYALGNLGRAPFTDSSEDWAVLAGVFLTDKNEWRQRLTKNEGFPAGKPAQVWKDRARAFFAAHAEHHELRGALADMKALPPERYSDVQWAVLGAIMRLLPRSVAQLKFVFQTRGQVDFTEVSQAALLALATDEGPTDLALALDYRIRHLLIDEFQDTSISQYELVARLTAGWEAGDGRTVFAVGDPMQSIYRFREAEVGLFLRARAQGIAGVDLKPIALTANFRSQAGIVEWVNSTFARVMPAREDIASGAVPYTASVATHAVLSGEAVSVHPFFNDDRVGEAAKVVEIVAQTQRDDATSRIAILVRDRGYLREIVPRLKDAKLRFRAIEIEGLGLRPVVQDLLALTRALSHPADRLAWLAVLRAPWCGLRLADLDVLAGKDHVHTVWEIMSDDTRVAALSEEGRARLLRVRDVLNACLEQRCRGPLRERIAGAWFALGGPACVEDTTDLEDAEVYFEYLDECDEAGEIRDRVTFEDGLAKLYALPDVQADERLQIMTIHKAKGLEFDTVIVPGLGRAAHSNDRKLFVWTEQPRTDGSAANDLLLAPIQETGGDGDPIYAWLEKLNAEKESLENERLLYVAATRAKRRLHLMGEARLAPNDNGVLQLKPPSEKTLLRKLWPVVEPVFAQAAARAAESFAQSNRDGSARVSPGIDQTLCRLVAGWCVPLPPPHVTWKSPSEIAQTQEEIEFSWVGETARHVGSVVHRWLQRIADDQMNAWDEPRIATLREVFRHELMARSVAGPDIESAMERVTQALRHAVTDERGRWLLGPQPDARNELRITSRLKSESVNLVIDRTFVMADGKRWIVDYKTSGHEGADVDAFLDGERIRYEVQLARYAGAISSGPGTRLGLYFPLLAGWREWES